MTIYKVGAKYSSESSRDEQTDLFLKFLGINLVVQCVERIADRIDVQRVELGAELLHICVFGIGVVIEREYEFDTCHRDVAVDLELFRGIEQPQVLVARDEHLLAHCAEVSGWVAILALEYSPRSSITSSELCTM